MSRFEGYYPETAEILLGIRMNNNKEWFEKHKAEYKKFVHEPTRLLGEEVFRSLKDFDQSFDDIPKVSRVNRDIRFSKEKLPYKDNKWVMFRKDLTPNIMHENPTYFFEISLENYRFGLGFWASAKGMEAFRKKLDAKPSVAEGLIKSLRAEQGLTFEAEYYKRNKAKDKPEALAEWYNCKWFNYIYYREHDEIMLKKELAELVAGEFEKLYSLYKFLR